MAALDVRILGLGNVLMGDDAFGPFVVESLGASYDLPPNVTLVDLGTPGLDLTPFLSGADVVIVIDAVREAGPAGTVRVYRREELFQHGAPMRLGPHDPSFAQTLLTLEFAGSAPHHVVLVGAIPQQTAPCARMTTTLRRAVPDAVDAVVRELEALGAHPIPRPSPFPITPWWERVA